MFAESDAALVEGRINDPGTRIKVWREAIGRLPLATQRHDITAVVSDERPRVELPLEARNGLAHLAGRVLNLRTRLRQAQVGLLRACHCPLLRCAMAPSKHGTRANQGVCLVKLYRSFGLGGASLPRTTPIPAELLLQVDASSEKVE